MKKVFTLLWSVLALLMVANVAQAQETRTLYFGENSGWSLYTDSELKTQYTGNDGKWSAEANKLTLDGFTFETSSTTAALIMPKNSTLTLAEGSVNTISNTIATTGEDAVHGIFVSSTDDDDVFTINGSGKLEVSVGKEGEDSESIICAIETYYGIMRIDGANLTAKAFNTTGSSSAGIKGDTGVEIKNGAIVSGSAGTAKYGSIGIQVPNPGIGLTVADDCVVTAQGRINAIMGNPTSSGENGIPDPESIPVYASKEYDGTGASLESVSILDNSEYIILEGLNALWVQIGGTLPVDHTLYFDEGTSGWSLYTDKDFENQYTGNSGKWSAEPNKLTLDGFTFETTAETGLMLPSYITTEIELTENTTNTITVNKTGRAIGIQGLFVTIEGGGTLDVNATGTTQVNGILLTGGGDQSKIIGATVKVSASSGETINTALHASAGSLAIYDGGSLHADGSNSSNGIGINIQNANVEIGTTSGTNATMGSLTAQGGSIAISTKGVLPMQDGFVYSESSNYNGSSATTGDATKGTNYWSSGTNKYINMKPNPTVPTTADYTLYFGQMTDSDKRWSLFTDIPLTEAKEYTEGKNDKWSAAENKLTLDGFNFTTTAGLALVLNTATTIVLAEGSENSFTSGDVNSNGVYGCVYAGENNLTIEGTGSLTISSGDNTYDGEHISYITGLWAGELTLTDGTITVAGGTAQNYSYGIYAQMGLNIDGATVVSSSEEAGSTYGVRAGNLIMTSGSLDASANSEEGNSYGLFLASGETNAITGGTITASVSGDGRLMAAIYSGKEIAGVSLKGGASSQDAENALVYDTVNYYYMVADAVVAAKYAVMTPVVIDYPLFFGKSESGSWSLYTDEDLINPYAGNEGNWIVEENKLTLEGFTFETTAQYALILLAEDVTLSLANGTTNTISSTYDGVYNTVGILAEGNLTITGNTGILNATVSNTENTGNNLNYAINVNGSFTLEGGVVNATGSKDGLRTVKDGLVSGGKLTAIGKNYGLSYNSNFTVSGNGEIHAVGNETAIAGNSPLETTGIATGNLTGKPTDPLEEVTWGESGTYLIDGYWAQYVKVTGDKPGGEETGIYHTITLDIATGIELHNMTAGNHSVEEGSHLHLQFLPEDRTLTAADILFLIDGVETEFTELGENNFFSYILNPVTQDHTILVALKEYPVILPEVEGVTYDVGAGTHLVGYGEKFTFILTLAEGIDPEKVHVYANGREILPDALRSVVLTYTIDKVLTPITVVIEGAGDPITGNLDIACGNIQIAIDNGELIIDNLTATAVDVAVYAVTGQSVVSLRGLRGSKTVRLQPGIYIVKAGNEVFKVSVN